MSGDVQPRKRKDKKRKRDSLDRRSEADIVITRKPSLETEEDEVIHHGVHATKMGTDDVHLHVQADHDTGGNWCAKIFFFSLLAILIGLVGLIILENRGLADLDTPLSESKYKDYFEGWVDEHRESHDDHHKVVAHEIEEHEEHDEPFEEEEDHQDEDEDEDEHDSHDDDHDDDDDGDDDDETKEDNETAEEDNDNNTAEDNDDDEEDDTDKDNNDTNEEDDDDQEEIIEKSSSPKYQSHKGNSKDTTENKNDDDDDDDDDDADDDDDNDDDDDDKSNNDEKDDDDDEDDNKKNNNVKGENKDDDDEDDEDADEDDDDDEDDDKQDKINSVKNKVTEDDDPFDEHVTNSKKHSYIRNNSSINHTKMIEKNITNVKTSNRTHRTEEYDGTFESLEGNIVDNDGEELRLLQEKAKLAKQNEKSKLEEEEKSASSSILVKIGVGLALAYVARLVIIKKGPEDDKRTADAEPDSEILMQRRLTIAPDNIPYENNEDELIYDNEYEEDEIVSSENGEIEDEEYIEEIEIEIEDDQDDESGNIASAIKYSPETFEQLNSMFRSSNKESGQSLDDYKKNIIEPVLLKSGVAPLQSKMTNMPPQNITAGNKSPILKKSESPALEQFDPEPSDIKDYENEELDEEMDDEMIEEEEDEEDISDIDDTDLMKRLDEKYGKIPDREYESEDMEEEEIEVDADDNSWTKIKRSSGAQYYDDDLTDELNKVNDEMLQNNFKAALRIYEEAYIKNPNNPKVFYGLAKTLEKLSEIYKSQEFLKESIEAYKRVLAFHDTIDDDMFKDAGINCIERMRFMGIYNQAIHIHEMLITKFNNEPELQNQLAVTHLMNNSLFKAKLVLENIIKRWPNNGYTQVHYGFVLANLDKNYKEAIKYLQMGIDSEAKGTQDGRFYFLLGDSLHRLGRVSESREIYKKGVLKKLFLSEYQRSLYNVDTLKSKPFWSKTETTYENFLNLLENNWKKIRQEGIDALNEKGYFVDEAESLKESGDWKQFNLFGRGTKYSKNCLKAPITCSLIESFPAARYCKRGQTKFSVMHPNTHVWPHCGPSNCRLRTHLGLVVPSNTWIRVANETIRSWDEGKVMIFDDSFEHEVWHNGTSLRLVLIVDVWHPDLNESQRHQLTAI